MLSEDIIAEAAPALLAMHQGAAEKIAEQVFLEHVRPGGGGMIPVADWNGAVGAVADGCDEANAEYGIVAGTEMHASLRHAAMAAFRDRIQHLIEAQGGTGHS